MRGSLSAGHAHVNACWLLRSREDGSMSQIDRLPRRTGMRLRSLALSTLAFALSFTACRSSTRADDTSPAHPDSNVAKTASAPAPIARVAPHIEEVAVPGDAAAYSLRGDHAQRMNILFLQGMCGHPLWYVQSMQRAAADHGDLLAVQADVPCGENMWRWSSDLSLMSRRFDNAFAAAAAPRDAKEPRDADGAHDSTTARDLVLVGYSQGAERIEWFAARYPEKVRAVVLMSGPIVPSVKKLAHVHAAVFTAGTREWQGNMRAGYDAFRAAGIPAKYIEIPGAVHGDLGADPNAVMNEAFDFIEQAENRRAQVRRPS
jgi:predicted esterase